MLNQRSSESGTQRTFDLRGISRGLGMTLAQTPLQTIKFFPLKPRQDVPRGATVSASDTIAREATEANATFNRMVAEFRDSPPQRLERDRAELERMSNDPHFQNALAPGHQGAKTKLTAVNARIATAEQELTSCMRSTGLKQHSPVIRQRIR